MSILQSVACDFTEETSTVNVVGTTFTKIHESSDFLELGKRYLLLVRALVRSDSTTNGEGVTLKVKYNGSYDENSVYLENPWSVNKEHQYAFVTVLDSSRSLSQVELYMAAEAAGVTGVCEYASILLLDISDFVEGVDYFYEVDKTLDANTTTWQDRATSGTLKAITQNEGEWLIIGHAQQDFTNITNQRGVQSRISIQSEIEQPQPVTNQEGEWTSEYASHVIAKTITLRADDVVTLQTQDYGLSFLQNNHVSSQIFGLYLGNFTDSSSSYNTIPRETTATTWQTASTCSTEDIGAGNTQDYLVIGSFTSVPESSNRNFRGRIRNDNGTGTAYSIMDSSQDTEDSSASKDSDDRQPVFMFGVATVDGDNGVATFSTEFRKTSSANYGIDDDLCACATVGDGAITRERLVWNGSADEDLLNASNWTPAQVPTTQDDIIFSSGSNGVSNSSVVVRNAYFAKEYSGSVLSSVTLTARSIVVTSTQVEIKAAVKGRVGQLNGDYYPLRVVLWDTSSIDDKINITCSEESSARVYIRNTRGRVKIGGSEWDNVTVYSNSPSNVLISGSPSKIVLSGNGSCKCTLAPTEVITTGRCKYTQQDYSVVTLRMYGRSTVDYQPTVDIGSLYLYDGKFFMTSIKEQHTPTNVYVYNAYVDMRTGIDGLVQPLGNFQVLASGGKILFDTGTNVAVT